MPMIEIYINSKAQTVARECNLRDIINSFDLPEQGCVFAINNQVIPKSEWHNTLVSDGDAISLFQAIAGG